MATTVSKTFGAVGFGNGLAIKNGDKFTYSVSGTFVGTVRLTESIDGGASWSPTGVSATGSASGTYFAKLRSASSALYRWECTAYTSGAIVTSLVDADIHLQEWYSNDGILAGYVDETGFNGGTLVSGAGFADGLVGTPSFAYVLDTDTGFYRIGSGDFAATCNGTQSVEFKSSGALVPNGSSSAPSYSFSSDTDLGLYRAAANVLGITASGQGVSNVSLYLSDALSSTATFTIGRSVNTASVSLFGGDSNTTHAGITLYGHTHATKSDVTEFYNLGALTGSISAAGAWTIGASGGTQSHSIFGALSVTAGFAAGSAHLQLSNTSNDDVISRYLVNGVYWSTGIDYSDTQAFKISKNSGLGTNDYFRIGTNGNTILKSAAAATTLTVKASDDVTVATINTGDAYTITLGRSGATETHTVNGNILDCLSSADGTSFNIRNGRSTASSLYLNGSSTAGDAGVIMYGSTHATRAYNTAFLNNGLESAFVDSNKKWNFKFGVATQRIDVASAATITALDSTKSFVKLTGSTATALQGITAGVDGQKLTLVNLTGANLTVQNENAGATAANRITTMTGADVATTANGAAEFIYDTGSSRWICLYVTA